MKLKFLLFCCLSLLIYSCSDKDDNESPAQEPNKAAEEQINKVMDALEEEPELSTFREALSNINTEQMVDKEFTILAYKNQIVSKATSSQSDSITQQTMRHIIGGKYTFDDLKKLKKLLALSKDTLYIEYSEVNKTVSINGVELGKSILSDKSIIFVTNNIVPQVKDSIPQSKEKEYIFQVMNINTNWSLQNTSESALAAKGATINIYEGDKVIKELTTDNSGIAHFSYNENNNLDYVVKTDTSSMIYEGYLVTGLFTTQAQVDQSPAQEGKYKGIPGGLRFADIDGDGRISSNDKTDRASLKNLSDNTIIYLVGQSYTFPSQEVPKDTIDIDMAYDAYDGALALFERVDFNYATLKNRQTLSPNSRIVDTLWHTSYDAILKINTILGDNTIDKIDRAELEGFRANLHVNLSLMFGDVPLQLTSKKENIARSTEKTIYDFALASYNEILPKYALSRKYQSSEYVNMILLYKLKREYTSMYNLAKEGIDSYTLELRSDGQTDANIVRPYLLMAEAANELGYIVEAIQTMNKVLSSYSKTNLAPGITTEQLRTYIREFYPLTDYYGVSFDNGMKYGNIKTWALNSGWGTYKLLPIPQSALTAFGNGTLLTQNSGY